MSSRNPLTVLGVNNQSLHIDGPSVVYTKKEHRKIIPIAQVTGVTIYPAYLWEKTRFYIATAKSFFDGGAIIRLETKEELPYAQNIQKYIADFQANAAAPSAPTSVADELVKLNALVEQGILTQEEFDHKKKVLLGL